MPKVVCSTFALALRLGALTMVVATAACGARGGESGAGGQGFGDGGLAGAPGGSGGTMSTEIPGLESIKVEPAEVSFTIEKGKPAKQQFKALGTFAGGKQQDITSKVSWSIDSLGRATVDKAGLATTTDDAGGVVKVRAQAGAKFAVGVMNLKLKVALLDPRFSNQGAGGAGGSGAGGAGGAGAGGAGGGVVSNPLPADPASKFGGKDDAALAPDLIYPSDGVLLPPNLFGIELHFRPKSATTTLYELQFEGPSLDLRVYTRCTQLETGCLYQFSREAWRYLAESGRGSAPITVKVRATDDAGTAVGASGGNKIMFSKDDILGGIYYWTTSQDTGIMRWDFGDTTKSKAERIVGKPDAKGTCVGCHALSRDGRKMVVSAGGQNDGRLLLFDVAQKSAMVPFPLAQKSQFESWNPTGSEFVGVYGDDKKQRGLLLFDGMSGMFKTEIPVGEIFPDHPDWSKDGNRIVYTTVAKENFNTNQMSYMGGLSMIEKMGATWSAPIEIFPSESGKNRYYPAISPDNSFFVFNESTCPAGSPKHGSCNFDMDPSAKLWARAFAAGAKAIELARANAPGLTDGGKMDLTNSFPKWSPFVFQLSEDRSLLWLTFSSERNYGLRTKKPNSNEEGGRLVLLWMVGVEPAKLAAGEDPSFAAFALPFQDLDSENHIAQWTEKVIYTE